MTGIILQARMGSTRLPGKIVKKIGSKTLLEHIVFRLGRLRHPARLVIATSTLPADQAVADFCMARSIACFRGSETDVLDRYEQCAKQYRFDPVVRLTGDNPFVDIEELDRLIDLYEQSGAAFCHSYKSLPMGVGAEIFSSTALQKSAKEGKSAHHREHVDEYLLEHPELFKTRELSVPKEKHVPELRLTVDTDADYKKACYIVEHAANEFVTTEEAIKLCSAYA